MVVLVAAACLLIGLSLVARRPAVPDEPEPVCPTRPGVPLDQLLADAEVLSCDVEITEVVVFDDEVVVGTSHGTYHLHLPWPFARQQALDRLHWWRISGTRLVAFHTPAHQLAGIADEHTGQFLCTADRA